MGWVAEAIRQSWRGLVLWGCGDFMQGRGEGDLRLSAVVNVRVGGSGS